MDLLKLIRSFEEFLFEAMAWLIYYPRTMWLIARYPLKMMDYSDHEQHDAETEQYTETLSPPLLLFLTIVLTHALALSALTPASASEAELTGSVFGSDQNLVFARSLVFALFPLTAALLFVRRTAPSLERKYLRPPFYGQCYLAAPYALAMSLGTLAAQSREQTVSIAGGGVALAATIAYLAVQTAQFRRCLGIGAIHAFGLSLRAYLEAMLAVIAIGFVLFAPR